MPTSVAPGPPQSGAGGRTRVDGWPHQRPSRADGGRLVPLLYLGLAALFCWHLLGDPAHRVTAGNPNDHALISWFLQAEPTALLHGHDPLWLPVLNAPDGVNSMWNTGLLLPAIVLAPVTLTVGGTFSFNLLLVLGLSGSAWMAYLVARRYTRRRVSAFVAGLLYGFSPAMTHQANGHLQLVFAVFVPHLLAAFVDVLTMAYSRRTALRLGLLATAQLLTGEEMLTITAIAAAALAATLALSRPRTTYNRRRTLARGIAVAAAAFTATAAAPLGFQFFGPRQQYGSAFGFDIFKADLSSFATPDRLLLIHSAASARAADVFTGGPPEQSAFLGWPLILCAVAMVLARWTDLRVRAAGATGVALGVLSLGGRLKVSNQDTPLRLPWSHFQKLPVLEALLPNRFGLLVAGLVGLVLAVALDATLDVPQNRRPLARQALCLIGIALLLLPLTPRLLRAAPRPSTPTFISTGLSHTLLPSGATVLVLPYPTPDNPVAMDWQADDGLRWSMPGGYFGGPGCAGRHCLARATLGGYPRSTSALLTSIGSGATDASSITTDDVAQAQDDFAYWHVSRIVIGPAVHQQELRRAMTILTRRDGDDDADCYFWELSAGVHPKPGSTVEVGVTGGS